MNKDDYADALADLVKVGANIERMKEEKSLRRLKELGWQDFTIRERMILQNQDAECADDLYKAFEKAGTGIRYCYSEQEVVAFLEQLEAHIS
jgi:hypothetical protein